MRCISTDKIKYRKPEKDDFLVNYNEMLARILVNNFSSFKYRVSATINRIEAQTHFFEYLEKYVQIIEMLNADLSLCVEVSKNDAILYDLLKEKFKKRISKDFKKTTTEKVFFILTLLSYFMIELFLLIVSKALFKLRNKHKYIIRTYFDFRCVESKTGRIRDDYFDKFLEDLKVSSDVLVVFKLLYLRNWRNCLRFFRAKKDVGFDVCLLEYFLTPYDLCKSFVGFIKSRIILKDQMIYKSQDVSKLINLFLKEDYFNRRGLGVYLEYYMAEKILKLNPERLFYPFENQTWEKVYPLIKKKSKLGPIIVGFQHTGFSYKLLNHFPCKIERHLPIFPDIIVTTGKIFKKILLENSYLPSEIRVGAALRHDKFVENGSFVFKTPERKVVNGIAYAFSSDIEKHFRVVNLLLDVFENANIKVYLKFHPLFDEKLILRRLSKTLPENFIPASTIPWQDIYSSVDAVLYDDNSISIEGILNGLKTYRLDEEEPIYNIERMFGFDEWSRSLNKEGLLGLKQAYNLENVKTYIKGYFSEYSKESSFESFVS
jgi:hypothetical protein